MKKIVLAFSCLFLMSGVTVADDNRYTVVRISEDGYFAIVDTKKERIKYCSTHACEDWQSWGD